jgi:hypothetical protein
MTESNSHNAVPAMEGSAVFGPASTRMLEFVLTEICDDLNIVADKTAKEIIAIRLLELVQSGVRDPAMLRRRLLDEAEGGTGC